MNNTTKKTLSPAWYLQFSLRQAPVDTGFTLLLQLALAILSPVQLWVLANLIDSVLTTFSGSGFAGESYLWAGCFIGCIASEHLLQVFLRLSSTRFRLRINTAFQDFLLKKHTALAYPVLESQDSGDLIHRVSDQADNRICDALDTETALLSCAIRMIGIAAAAASKSWLFFPGVLAFFLVTLPLAKKCGEEDYQAYSKASALYRRSKYLRSLLSGREFAPERTLFRYGDSINREWEEKEQEARLEMQRANWANTLRSKAASCLILLLCFLMAVGMLAGIRRGSFSVGLFVSLLTGLIQIISMLTWNLSSYLEDFTEQRCYLEDLQQFLTLPETAEDAQPQFAELGQIETVEFKNVSFRYPGSDSYVLKGVSMVLEAGRSYALVGLNGSGKSTLIKLLAGLYPDYTGSILVNSVDIRTLPRQQLPWLLSVVYQDFSRYQLTLRENIALGASDSLSDADLHAALDELKLVDKVDSSPLGLDKELGRLGDTGSDLSGGQWQKIAIARSLLRQTPLLILDEPTAALDPGQEQRIYETLLSPSGQQIRLFITHRLGGIRGADTIFVLDGGKIREEGTHDALMRQQGVYASLYASQRRWYQ